LLPAFCLAPFRGEGCAFDWLAGCVTRPPSSLSLLPAVMAAGWIALLSTRVPRPCATGGRASYALHGKQPKRLPGKPHPMLYIYICMLYMRRIFKSLPPCLSRCIYIYIYMYMFCGVAVAWLFPSSCQVLQRAIQFLFCLDPFRGEGCAFDRPAGCVTRPPSSLSLLSRSGGCALDSPAVDAPLRDRRAGEQSIFFLRRWLCD
jgi:hypothetical protein